MEEESRICAYITEIKFNDGSSLSIQENDIVLFVGPNNAGKSQALSDIYTLCSESIDTVVVSEIRVNKTKGSLQPLLESVSKGNGSGPRIDYSCMTRSVGYSKNDDVFFMNRANYGTYREWFVARLDTSSRLNICYPAESINRNAIKRNPIHYAAFETKHREWLSKSYYRAFGQHLTPNTLLGQSIPLCIGEEIKLSGEYRNEMERQDIVASRLETYKQVHNQGDGVKSFTGILLYLMLDYFSTYIIDEPESFLHPPQADIMGRIIGETLNDHQQAFISTHSENIVKGLLDVCADRLKIVRITRNGDKNSFSILDNTKIKGVFGDPLLKYSNIMSSLFHKTVVLCESDSDCKLYSAIDNYLKQAEGKYSETLFIHCGGKQRMAKTAGALKALNIDVKLIPDIDVLNDENILKGITDTFGIEWESIKPDYNNIVCNLHSPRETINRSEVRSIIDNVLNASNDAKLSLNEIKQIQDSVKVISKWDGVKHGGKQALPAGNATKSFERLDEIFRNHNIFLVPVGELEGFVKTVGGHGTEWVNGVLEQYPDLNNPIYKDLREFIQGMRL